LESSAWEETCGETCREMKRPSLFDRQDETLGYRSK